MVLLRRVLGDALRARRQAQHRTLREVSGAANVSLGYLSEIERGQKEASSELLAAICEALGAHLSELLREVSDTMELAELTEAGVRAPESVVVPEPVPQPVPEPVTQSSARHFVAPASRQADTVTNFVADGAVAVAVRRDGPFRTTLTATRSGAGRDLVPAA
jgi:transcriptional regulator with XRE-family HTH domain